MDEGNEDKCHVEVEEDPTVLFIREIDGSHTFKAHQQTINGDPVEYQNQDHANHP